jgi:Sec-independent protein secretion pathway component TatC
MEKLLKLLASIPKDKALHALGGVLMFAIGILFSLPIAASLVLANAVIKELYNKRKSLLHTFDPWDGFATCCGGLLGFMCAAPYLYQHQLSAVKQILIRLLQ